MEAKTEDGFTALGSIYLVRRSAMQLVRLWRWKEAEGAAGAFESLRAADGPLVPQPGLPPPVQRPHGPHAVGARVERLLALMADVHPALRVLAHAGHYRMPGPAP